MTSAKKQIVAGVNYFLKIQMEPEECSSRRSETNGDESASVSADALMCELKQEECDLTVWEQVWLNSTQLTDVECTTRRLVNNLGARHRIDNNDESARHALAFAVAEMSRLHASDVYYVPVVQNTYKQIVNGVKYTFEFEYAPTKCAAMPPLSEENMNEFRSESECKVDESKQSISCVVSVLDQFWLADEENSSSASNTDQESSNAAGGEPVYKVETKPSRYHLTLKNCV